MRFTTLFVAVATVIGAATANPIAAADGDVITAPSNAILNSVVPLALRAPGATFLDEKEVVARGLDKLEGRQEGQPCSTHGQYFFGTCGSGIQSGCCAWFCQGNTIVRWFQCPTGTWCVYRNGGTYCE